MIFGAYGNAETDVEAYLKVGIRWVVEDFVLLITKNLLSDNLMGCSLPLHNPKIQTYFAQHPLLPNNPPP